MIEYKAPTDVKEARRMIIAEFEDCYPKSMFPRCQSYERFAHHYNDGFSKIPGIYVFVRRLSSSTLQRWIRQVRVDGEERLRPRYGNRKGCGKIDSNASLRRAMARIAAGTPGISPRKMRDRLSVEFDPAELPSVRTFQRFMSRARPGGETSA